MSMQLSNWLMRHPGTRRPFRLYCLPYAGGSGTVFLPWQDALRSDVEVCGIQLPGRGARLAEPPMTSIQQVAETLAQIICLRDRDLPFAFFGHSLGGLVAFELARYCRRYQLPMPLMIIVSGSDAPQHRTPEKNLHTLPDDELLLALADYNGTPPEVLRHSELMSLALPSIRADFTMAANYVYQPSVPLSFRFETTRWATRSLLMMSTCVAMKPGDIRPPYITAETGSGLKSTTTLAVAVYCLGSMKLTPTVVPTVNTKTSNATHQRARKIDRN